MPPGRDTAGAPEINRRRFVAGFGVGMAGLAGCASGEVADATPGATVSSTRTGGDPETEQSESDDYSDGGVPIIGLGESPDTLNPLAGSHALFRRLLFTFGTEFHPATAEFVPWAFEEWSVSVDNVGTASPTLVGQLRDDLTFSDGRRLTAEDAKFTVEYIKEQKVAGSRGASGFEAVESVQVDDPQGQTVSYFFSTPDAGWFTSVLGQILLPKHVWKDVADYRQYSPLTAPEGVVGSGAFEVDSVDKGNWFELSTRPDEAIWQTRAPSADWYHQGAPFIDGVRIQIFGSADSMRRAVFDGEIDAAFDAVAVDTAIRAKSEGSLAVATTETAGWHHHSYNTRRVPLDDPAFRQLLVKLVDKHWIVEELDKGIGSVAGSYAMPKSRTDWRPPEPHEVEGYRGIPTPALHFPGKPGSFELTNEGVETARSFLVNHSQSQYDYSWEAIAADDSSVTAEEILHVDGVPFQEAHTDNERNRSQGPLVVSFNPPGEDIDEARIVQEWIPILRSVGIPAEPQIQSFDSQVEMVFGREDFDVMASNWTDVPVDNTYFKQLFGRWGADLDGTADFPRQNPMGYTGADELIQAQRSTMDADERKPIVKQVLARIWHDAPTNILKHDLRLQLVNQSWDGWIKTAGLGVVNLHTLLNLRRVRPES